MEIAQKYRLFVICFCAVWMQIGGIFVCVPGFGKSRPHLRGKRDTEVPFRIAKAGDAEKNAALRKNYYNGTSGLPEFLHNGG